MDLVSNRSLLRMCPTESLTDAWYRRYGAYTLSPAPDRCGWCTQSSLVLFGAHDVYHRGFNTCKPTLAIVPLGSNPEAPVVIVSRPRLIVSIYRSVGHGP